jgi:hypothetical protein
VEEKDRRLSQTLSQSNGLPQCDTGFRWDATTWFTLGATTWFTHGTPPWKAASCSDA